MSHDPACNLVIISFRLAPRSRLCVCVGVGESMHPSSLRQWFLVPWNPVALCPSFCLAACSSPLLPGRVVCQIAGIELSTVSRASGRLRRANQTWQTLASLHFRHPHARRRVRESDLREACSSTPHSPPGFPHVHDQNTLSTEE